MVDAEALAEIAYYRDRYDITDQANPLGDEPPSRHRRQHDTWRALRRRVLPTGSLHELAGRRDAPDLTAVDAARVDSAMRQRREQLAQAVHAAPRPPGWARPLVGQHWSTNPGVEQRQRDVVARAAVYRDRYEVTGDGLGDAPADPTRRRIWAALRREQSDAHTRAAEGTVTDRGPGVER